MANEALIDVAAAVTVAGDGSKLFDTFAGEIVKEPQFHRFRDMPLELRQQVYEEYFLDEQDSICRGWPHIRPNGLRVSNYSYLYAHGAYLSSGPFSHQFFPNLCLVNHETGFEAAKFLVSTAELFVEHYSLIKPIISKLSIFRARHLLKDVHRMVLACLGCIHNYEHNWDKKSWWTPHGNSDCYTTAFYDSMYLVSQCPQLRELNLLFTAGLQRCTLIGPDYSPKEAHPIMNFEPIFACKELRKLNITGENLNFVSGPKTEIDQEQENIWDMEQWLMDEFAARGKVVDVQSEYIGLESDEEESDEEEINEE